MRESDTSRGIETTPPAGEVVGPGDKPPTGYAHPIRLFRELLCQVCERELCVAAIEDPEEVPYTLCFDCIPKKGAIREP